MPEREQPTTNLPPATLPHQDHARDREAGVALVHDIRTGRPRTREPPGRLLAPDRQHERVYHELHERDPLRARRRDGEQGHDDAGGRERAGRGARRDALQPVPGRGDEQEHEHIHRREQERALQLGSAHDQQEEHHRAVDRPRGQHIGLSGGTPDVDDDLRRVDELFNTFRRTPPTPSATQQSPPSPPIMPTRHQEILRVNPQHDFACSTPRKKRMGECAAFQNAGELVKDTTRKRIGLTQSKPKLPRCPVNPLWKRSTPTVMPLRPSCTSRDKRSVKICGGHAPGILSRC